MFYGKPSVFESAEMTIDIVQNGAIATGDVYPQPHKTGVLWDAYLIKAIHWQDNQETLLYFSTAIQKTIKEKFSYDKKATWERVKEEYIWLPVSKNDKIDIAFIEEYMHELEDERLLELETFFREAGFEDCTLTKEEKEALIRVRDGNVNFVQIKIGDILIGDKGDIDIQNKDINGRGLYFVNSGVLNFVIKGKTDRKAKVFSGNTITVDFLGNAYYRPFSYVMATHNHVFSLSGDSIKNEDVGLYLCSSMSFLKKIYSFNNMGIWPIYKTTSICLPRNNSNGQIDYAFMKAYISAIKKQCIARLKQEINREYKTYNKVQTERNCTTAIVNTEKPSYKKLEVEFEPLIAAEPFECYKWKGFDQSICDFFGSNQTILIGCYKGKKYYDWIHSHNIYNIRLGKTKGSMEKNRKLFESTSLLILYELGKPNKLSAYKITGHHEISKDELIKLDYPNKKPRKSYMAFDISPLEMDLTFLVEHHLIERLLELNANNAKGTPVFIEP